MSIDLSADNSPPRRAAPSDPELTLRLVKARHELHSSIAHILGFSEMWLEELQGKAGDSLQPGLQLIFRTASEMMEYINEGLAQAKIEAGPADLSALERRLCEHTSEIIAATESLARDPHSVENGVLKSDLSRIAAAGRRIEELARTSFATLSETALRDEVARTRSGPDLVEFEAPAEAQSPKEGTILVVDDQEENRELLCRRLSRLGYSVQLADSGQHALESIAANPADLILLDILMPGLDGIEVLHRLKADPRTQHIPVIMLSSADQIDTVVRCIHLGADDFLPKPFNATLLMARIQSSLSKKRLRDQETAFVQRLQAEQDTSERLLLNILPKPVAERLKQGEKTIADSFPEATVLFSDFVDFTKLSTGIPPKVLVGRLNEIFSAFDHLCERHGLEKIKMIGDAYMAVGGVPTPCGGHAQAAADVALAMQKETARFTGDDGQTFRLRIGLNSGAVVAGVIGTRKFAYDLWGDTVNIASRMETHAPPGGILVTASTHQLLRGSYSFKPGRVIRVKGKGEVLTYLLLGKKLSRLP
jgi:adenylate cyclase